MGGIHANIGQWLVHGVPVDVKPEGKTLRMVKRQPYNLQSIMLAYLTRKMQILL